MNKTITPTNKKTMKSFSSFIFTALCCVMALLPTVDAKAWGVTQDGIKYELIDGREPNMYVSKAYNVSGDIEMPAYFRYNGRNVPVTIIYHNVFEKQSNMFSLTTPTTLKTIEGYAFLNATGLTRINIQEGLSKIEGAAFRLCTGLTKVILPNSLNIIEYYTFEGCSALPEILIPAAITTIKDYAFSNCTSLKNVYGANGVTSIGARAFGNCPNLSYINLHEAKSLTQIGESAFYNCKLLERVTLPASVATIGDFAFQNSGLKELTVLRTVPVSIKANVFSGVNLAACVLIVPKGCKAAYKSADVWKNFGVIVEEGEEIGEIVVVPPITTGEQKIGNLYYDLHEDLTATVKKHVDNKNLSGELTVPSSVNYGEYTYTVTAMDQVVFEGCTKLTKAVLPITITELPNRTFSGCSALTSVTLPASLEKIGHSTFAGTGITSISLPSTVSSLGSSVFENCAALTSVRLPAGITTIPNSCFFKCAQLKNVKIPSAVTKIEGFAFSGCSSLSTITIPANVSSIEEMAFHGCNGLQSIKCERNTPVDLSGTNNVFNGVHKSTCILYVPGGSKNAYSNAAVWKDFKDIRETGVNMKVKYGDLYYQLHEDYTAEVTYEKENDANNYKDLSGEVMVEDVIWYQGREYNVNAVGAYAFANTKNVTKVILPKIMDEIDVYAFVNSNLQEINIPGTLEHLSYTAFEGTPLFTNNMDAQHSVYYDGCLLYHEPNTTSGTYTVKEGTRLIASYAFCGANADYSITKLELPEGLECICAGAIDYMQALKTLNIPSTVYSIQDYFLTKYCSDLQNIYCYTQQPVDISGLSHAFSYWTKEELALITLYVPAGTRTAYQKAEKWKDFSIVEMKPIYTVTFEDYDGMELKTEQVEQGKTAQAPEDPTREGYDFTGWDKDFSNIQSDLTVTAQYKTATYKVVFVDGCTNEEINNQDIEYGGSATEPEVPEHEGYVYIGWDKQFDAITGNTIVTARYLEGDGVVTTVFELATGTLTYYYDSKLIQRPGVVEVYLPDSNRFKGYASKVVKAVIDPSMKDAKLTSMRKMFYGGFDSKTFGINSLRKMTSIEGLENLNTSGVTDMNGMFSMCESLQQLDLRSFNTKNVTDMNGMFTVCSKLETVDVSSFDISKVTDMGGLFMGCQSLTTIYCTNDWSNTSAKTTNMFFNCKLLVGNEGTKFDSSKVDATYARLDGGTEAPGYFSERKYDNSDVNCDGTTDTQDVLMIYEYMQTVGSEANGGREDVNGDGSVDTQDILMIYEFIRSH